MTRKLQIPIIFALFVMFALLGMAMSPVVVKLQSSSTATPLAQHTSTITPAPPSKTPVPVIQAGHSDWIAVIGILIVAIIVIPLVLKYKEWRVN